MKYSIITSMYNSFHLMHRYFDSLANQTYQDFEILIIDDCSTDTSYEELLDYVKTVNLNISVFQTPQNSGPGVARNIGLEHAQGDWITFIDSDDWVCLDWLEQLNQIQEEKDADCIVYDYNITNGEKIIRVKHGILGYGEGFVTSHDMIACGMAAHVKCFRRDYIATGAVRYPELRRGEDTVFFALLFASAEDMKIYYCKQPWYNVYQRKGSLSRTTTIKYVMSTVYSLLFEKLDDRFSKDLEAASIRQLLYGETLLMCQGNTGYHEIIQFIEKYEKMYPNWATHESIRKLGRSKKVFLWLIQKRIIFGMRLFAKLHLIYVTK